MLASTKYSSQQNIGVDKIFVSKKCWRRQNILFNKMLAHTWKHLLTVLAQQSPQQLTFPRPRWCSPTSPCSCWSLHVQSPSVLLPLLWADSLPHCTGLLYWPAMQKTSQILASTNIGTRQDFTNFRQTIAVNISAHRRPTNGENKKWSPSLSNISSHTHNLQIEAVTEIQRWSL